MDFRGRVSFGSDDNVSIIDIHEDKKSFDISGVEFHAAIDENDIVSFTVIESIFECISLPVVCFVVKDFDVRSSFLYLGFGVTGAMIAICTAYIIPYALSFLQSKDLPTATTIKARTKKNLMRYSLPTFLNLLFMTMLYSWDIILVKHLMSPEIAGQYAALSIFGKMILFAGGPIHQALFPMAASLMSQWKKQINLILQSLILVFLVGSTITVAFYSFPDSIVSTLMGESFLPIAKYLGIIAIIFTILSLSNTLLHFFISTENTKAYYVLSLGLILMSIGLFLFHKDLNEILKVIVVSNIFTFLGLLAYLGIISQRKSHERTFSTISNI